MQLDRKRHIGNDIALMVFCDDPNQITAIDIFRSHQNRTDGRSTAQGDARAWTGAARRREMGARGRAQHDAGSCARWDGRSTTQEDARTRVGHAGGARRADRMCLSVLFP